MTENSRYNRYPNCPGHIPDELLLDDVDCCEKCHLFAGDHCSQDMAFYEDHTPKYTDEELKRFRKELSKAEVDCRKTWPNCEMPCPYGYIYPETCGLVDAYGDVSYPMNDGFDEGFDGYDEDHRAEAGAFMRPSCDITIEEALEAYNNHIERMKEHDEQMDRKIAEYEARRKELETIIADNRRIIEENGMIPEACEALEDAQKELKELIDRFELPF